MLYNSLRCTDRLLDVFLMLLVVILSELPEKPRRKDEVAEKKYREEK